MTTAECASITCIRVANGQRGYCHICYRRRLHRGCYGLQDTAEVREHIAKLRGLGWTWEQIGQAAGKSHAIPYGLATGRYQRALPETVDALLRIVPAPASSRHSVNSLGLRRRVQALAWMGWPAREVAARAGTTVSTLRTLMIPRRRPSRALVIRVAVVYDQLAGIPGPSPHAARYARDRGCYPPAAWDDIDDPKERPKGVRKTAPPYQREVA